MSEPNIAVLERQSVQVKPDATKNPYGDGGFWSFVQARSELLAAWGTRQRELELRLWDRHPQMWIWQGAVAGLTKKLSSAPREIKGKNLVGYFDDVLRYANFGIGWDDFIAKGVRDFLRHDNGWYFEIIAPGNPKRPPTGRVTGIAHLDSIRCYPTGDPEYPTAYYDTNGKIHLLHKTRVVHLVDMPDGDEGRPGYGLCALSRGISIATRELYMNRYIQTKLDDKPEPGYVFWKGVSEQQRINRFEKLRTQQMADDPAWGRVIHFESLDPANPVGAETMTFAQQPDKFDFKTYTELDVNAWALALGVDVQELWQLTGGNIGSGQQSQVLHAKSQGKTFGDLLTKLERALNTYVLPDTLEFEFKRHDPYEAQEESATAKSWAEFIGGVKEESTVDQRRRILANKVNAFKDAVTDEQGEIIRLPDQDVKPNEEQEQTIDDGAPPQDASDADPNAEEQSADDSKAKLLTAQKDLQNAVIASKALQAQYFALNDKAIQSTRLDFEADWSDMTAARLSGDMNSVRGDIVARALLAKYIPRAMRDGLKEGGVDEPDEDDSAEALALVANASAYVTDYNTTLDNGLSDAEAALKPLLWWNKSLLPAYDAGRYSADKNGLYQFVGDDGEKSCATCQRLSGQKHRMREWTRKQLRPGVDTKSYDCGGWQCNHRLVKTTGTTVGRF